MNAVALGPVYTRPAARKLFDTLGATTPLNRAAEPAEIAEVVAFLASSRARLRVRRGRPMFGADFSE